MESITIGNLVYQIRMDFYTEIDNIVDKKFDTEEITTILEDVINEVLVTYMKRIKVLEVTNDN